MLKLALPKGRLSAATASLLNEAGLCLVDYDDQTRSYRPRSATCPNLLVKVFQEKDIPVQLAMGNYDLGICGLEWVEELSVKYRSSSIIKLRPLGYGARDICLLAEGSSPIASLKQLQAYQGQVRIASEYPNLAELVALRLRLKRFRVFPVWGAAEAYPPDNAELALCTLENGAQVAEKGLVPLARIQSPGACLIANKDSWLGKDLAPVLSGLSNGGLEDYIEEMPVSILDRTEQTERASHGQPDYGGGIKLALPDGHQQRPTASFLERLGLNLAEYSGPPACKRPDLGLAGVQAKVIRPQDMPLQVATGNFDLAITGRDWLLDHLYRFPSSPATELLDLGFGRVRIVAVVSQELPVTSPAELRELLRSRRLPVLRVASEYVNIADRYARENHLSPYKVIPTWGASEAFLPEDADLLIENTETGRTLARHGLKIIDTLFQSSATLIGRRGYESMTLGESIASIVNNFRVALQA